MTLEDRRPPSGSAALVEHSPNELALPDADYLRRELQAIRQFQQIVHASLVKGMDYGVIPGTGNKPTLLKPGAEKLTKLLGLTDHYEIVQQTEDWAAGFFRYLVKCSLQAVRTGVVISESFGECNSMETKYRYRWVFERDIPKGVAKDALPQQKRQNHTTKQYFTMYRLDNDELYSQVNTILKMAQKRALVGAALSAGRLSELFTQDVEDMAETSIEDMASANPEPSASAEESVLPSDASLIADWRATFEDATSLEDLAQKWSTVPKRWQQILTPAKDTAKARLQQAQPGLGV